jgi:hypothetical protein
MVALPVTGTLAATTGQLIDCRLSARMFCLK